jgi:hypothetical protein
LGVPGPVRSAENTLYHDKDHPSHVILPIAARDKLYSETCASS